MTVGALTFHQPVVKLGKNQFENPAMTLDCTKPNPLLGQDLCKRLCGISGSEEFSKISGIIAVESPCFRP
jgi:hypothetical protein